MERDGIQPDGGRLKGASLIARTHTVGERRSRKYPNSEAPPHPFPHIPSSRSGLPLEDDPFGASSVAEQAWLDRNGYPNAIQMKEYTTASDESLQMAADSGDTVAKTYLDFRNFVRGVEGAESALLHSAAMGNSFALESLSSFHSGSSRGDRIMGYALSRVLEMRGNHSAGILRNMTMRTPLTDIERLNAETEALAIFNHFLELRRENQVTTPPVDPRPIGG